MVGASEGVLKRPRPLCLPAVGGASCWWGVAGAASVEFLLGPSPSAMLTSQTMVAAVGVEGRGGIHASHMYTGKHFRV